MAAAYDSRTPSSRGWSSASTGEWPTGQPKATSARRPGAASAAAALAFVSAGLLTGTVVLILARTISLGIDPATGRWALASGVVLTCAFAAFGMLGALSLFRGTGRGTLLGSAWAQIALFGTAWVAFVLDRTVGFSGEELGLAVHLQAAGVITAAVTTVLLAHRPSVDSWLTTGSATRSTCDGGTVWSPSAGRTMPRRRPGRGVCAVVAPLGILAVATAAVVATAAPRGAGDSTAGVGSVPSRAAVPPPNSANPEWSTEFAPDAEACFAGSMAACDDLFWESSVGDAYETYGSTCGGRIEHGVEGACLTQLGTALN